MSDTDENNKPVTESIKDKVAEAVNNAKVEITGEAPNTNLEEKISHNAKIILLSLFILVGFIVLLGTIVIYAKLEISVEVLTIVFSTAITGCFTLGGVLINAIWGK